MASVITAISELLKAPRPWFAIAATVALLHGLGINLGWWMVPSGILAGVMFATFARDAWKEGRQSKTREARLLEEDKRKDVVIHDLGERVREFTEKSSGAKWTVDEALGVQVVCLGNRAIELSDDGVRLAFGAVLSNFAPFPVEVRKILGPLKAYLLGTEVFRAENFVHTFKDMKLAPGQVRQEVIKWGPLSMPELRMHSWARQTESGHREAPGVISLECTVTATSNKWSGREKTWLTAEILSTWAHAQDERKN